MSAKKKYADQQEGSYYLVRIPAQVGGKQPRDIEFGPIPKKNIPPDYSALHIDIERTLTILSVLFPSDARSGFLAGNAQRNEQKFKEYYGKLASLAVAALTQDQVQLGRMALNGLQDEIATREAGTVKNSYIRRLGVDAILFAAPAIIFYLICRYGYPNTILYKFREFVSMIVGSFLGTWLSFSIRRVTLSFWDLAHLEEDRLDPGIRLLFVAGLTIVVGLLFSTKAIIVTIGGFNTAFLNSGTFAVLIGCLCGIGEQGLSTAVARRASEFISSIGGTTPPPASTQTSSPKNTSTKQTR
jgi:hypothetical protein